MAWSLKGIPDHLLMIHQPSCKRVLVSSLAQEKSRTVGMISFMKAATSKSFCCRYLHSANGA